MSNVSNPRFPHYCQIIRATPSEDPMVDETEQTVIYEGECRSYDKNTSTIKGEIIVSYRVLSLPVKQSEWTEDNIPKEGDWVNVNKGSYMEEGKVIDRMPGNLGTHILWKYGRN